MTESYPLGDLPPSAGRDGAVAGIGMQCVLDAMDGVVYLVSTEGHIVAVGEPAWERFAVENLASELASDQMIGRDFFSMLNGDEVRNAYRLMHEKLRLERTSHIGFDYRCDAVDVERLMRMSISAIATEVGVAAILYQSQIVRETERVPMMLFSPENYRKTYSDDLLVSLCSYCHNVAWPIGANQRNREWITPGAYYARGGPDDIAVSHGICPDCFERIVAPNIGARPSKGLEALNGKS